MYRGSAPAAGLTVLVTQWEPAWAVPGCGPDIVLLFLRFEGAEAPYALADPDFGINYFPGHRNKNSLPLLLLPVQLSTLIVIVLVIAGPEGVGYRQSRLVCRPVCPARWRSPRRPSAKPYIRVSSLTSGRWVSWSKPLRCSSSNLSGKPRRFESRSPHQCAPDADGDASGLQTHDWPFESAPECHGPVVELHTHQS